MITAVKSRVFLALGGNLGEPRRAFNYACSELRQHPDVELVAASPLYQTPPVGGPPGQADYLNAVVELQTGLTPQQLLDVCHKIEDAAGRTRVVRWEARCLDLDLLFYGQQQLETAQLTLPHPHLHQRHFVLLPLADLAAEFVHTGLKLSVAELLEQLPPAEGIRCIATEWIDND